MESDINQPQTLMSLSQKVFNSINQDPCSLRSKQLYDNIGWRHKVLNVTKYAMGDHKLPEAFPLQQQSLDNEQMQTYWKSETRVGQQGPIDNQTHNHINWMGQTAHGGVHLEKNDHLREYAAQQLETLMIQGSDQMPVGNTSLQGIPEQQDSLWGENGKFLYAANQRKQPVSNETIAERHRKLVSLARQQETTEQRETRLELNRLRTNFSRMTESPEQRRTRLETNRLYMKNLRQRESSANREVRLLKTRVSQNITRLTETDEQRQLRLLKNRIRMNAHRQRETPDKREMRLQKNRERMSALRQQETPVQRFERQQQDQMRHATSRKHETSDQRICRQNQDKIRHAYARQQETPAQRLSRQHQDKIRHAVVRQLENSEQRQNIPNIDKFNRESDEQHGQHQRYTHEIQQIVARMNSSDCNFSAGTAAITSPNGKNSNSDTQWEVHDHSAMSFCDTQMILPSEYHDDGELRVKAEYKSSDDGEFISPNVYKKSESVCFSNTASHMQCESGPAPAFEDAKEIKTELMEPDASF